MLTAVMRMVASMMRYRHRHAAIVNLSRRDPDQPIQRCTRHFPKSGIRADRQLPQQAEQHEKSHHRMANKRCRSSRKIGSKEHEPFTAFTFT